MSAFDTPWFNSQPNDFFNSLNKSKSANLVLTAETEDFDPEAEKQWREEGFRTTYVPLLKGGSEFIQRIHRAGDDFGTGEYYAVVGYGDAASLILEAHTKPNTPRLCALVAYYPTYIPATTTKFPTSVRVLAHLAGPTIGVQQTSEILGIQGKKKTVRKNVDAGSGHGGGLGLAYPAYAYRGCEPGFAEHDLDEFDPVAEGVAFTRSLETLRKGFRLEGNVEATRDALVTSTTQCQHEKTMGRVRDYAHVIHGPTLSGGVGVAQLGRFYASFFAPLPPSFSSRLLSRTVGTDQVVDELFVSFTHSSPVPWMLPSIPPTQKAVEVVVVSIMCVRGGKLESEHVYWDQASVLAQVGLIDAKLVPGGFKKRGVKVLPVVGAEGARAVKRGSSQSVNCFIPEWRQQGQQHQQLNGGQQKQGGQAQQSSGAQKQGGQGQRGGQVQQGGGQQKQNGQPQQKQGGQVKPNGGQQKQQRGRQKQ